jgi:hypothetical protein
MGELEAARAIETRVLALRIWTLGRSHPSTITSLNNLAGTFWALRKPAKARALWRAALAG